MTTTEVQQLELALSNLAGEVKTLNGKVDCLLDGKVANCARHDMRITQLEKHSVGQWTVISITAIALIGTFIAHIFK